MNLNTVAIERPEKHEYGRYFETYVNEYRGDDVLETLAAQGREACALFESRSDAEALFAYEPGKWTIKEIAGHLADSERIFACRALRIARGETTPLPSFDENEFMTRARFNELPIAFLVENLAAVRAATILLFRSFNEEELTRIGTASDMPLSVRATAYIIAGHERHHLDFINERYV